MTESNPCAARVDGSYYRRGRPCKRNGVFPVGWKKGKRIYACKQHKNQDYPQERSTHNEIASAVGLPLLPEVHTKATCPECGFSWESTVARGDSITYYCAQCSRQGRGVVAMTLTKVSEKVQ